MKYKLLLIGFIITILSCSTPNEKITQEQIFNKYISGLNNSGFSSFSKYLNDSIKFSEFDHLISNTKQELYTNFQWDSVFAPSYNLIDLKVEEDHLKATISKICDRIRYLHDSETVYKAIVKFDDNKISSISINEYVTFDFEKWQSRRDTLTAWIDQHHPELNGFEIDLTTKGGMNYLKAIELYKNN